jgi:hypothetical protein
MNAVARRPTAPATGRGTDRESAAAVAEGRTYDRLADLGPRGLELRYALDQFAAEHRDEEIASVAIPAMVTLSRFMVRELGPTPWLTRRRDLRRYLDRRRRETREDPGYPGEYYFVEGVLFQADGPNHLRPAEPIMRLLGDLSRPSAEIRASEHDIRSGTRRAIELARTLFGRTRARGVWVPGDLPSLYAIFISAAHALAHARALIAALSPRAVGVLATTNRGPRALLTAARLEGIPSVYFPHAPVLMDPSFNDLPTDFAGLRGPREAAYYADLVGPNDRVEVVGDPSIENVEMPAYDPSLPPVLAPPIHEADLRDVVRLVGEAVDGPVLVSPHPEADTKRLKTLIPSDWEIWTGRTYDLLRRGPPAILQFTSGIALEALMLGIPTVELRLPLERAITYPLIREPHVRIASDPDGLRRALESSYSDARSSKARRLLREWALEWSSPHGEEAARRGAALVERTAAASPPGPIWSAWPG